MRVTRDLSDPRGLLVAGGTLVANLLLQVPWPAALLAAMAVVFAFVLFRRLWPSRSPAPRDDVGLAGSLSRREMEIAVLVGSLSNKEIATRLFISERTVDNHVQHIFNKLGVHTRAQIAVWTATHSSRGSNRPE